MSDPLAPALHLVAERYPDELRVADLAEAVGYSPFHFSRLFTAATRVSPGQYVTAVRLDAAKRLLLATNDPVVDVATAVGFDSLSSFSRRFHLAVGVPPAGLRRLADTLVDRRVRPFSTARTDQPSVRVRTELPAQDQGASHVWLGWFQRPAPIGLPAAGVFAEAGAPISLPLHPGSPWLLGFAVPEHAAIEEQLTPQQPLVAVHPAPITSPSAIRLVFGAARRHEVPLLCALPSLYQGV